MSVQQTQTPRPSVSAGTSASLTKQPGAPRAACALSHFPQKWWCEPETFPVRFQRWCFYSVTQSVCPWKTRWSLQSNGGDFPHQRCSKRADDYPPLTIILPTGDHPWHHIPVMRACCCPKLRGAPWQWGRSGGWGTYHFELSAFWSPRVICLTAIKHWKYGMGSFMKAIIACKDWECLCWGPLAAEISIQICKHHPGVTFQ